LALTSVQPHAPAESPGATWAATVAAGGNFDSTGFAFETAEGPFEPDMKSFAKLYRCPDWFRDAKFGIYMHWGLGSVPGFHGHYARHMYTQEEPEAFREDKKSGRKPALSGYKPGSESVYQHHVARFGHPSKFGYKDFIPLWKADKFDAPALASLYKECGAKFVGVMAVHHDNFDLWDSTNQPWNSAKMGPRIDVVGAWKQACQKEGLRFFVTTHLSNEWHEHLFYQGQSDTCGPLKGVPYDTTNPQYHGLYGKRTPDGMRRLNPEFAQNWYRRMKELIDRYEPDLLYLDGGLPNGAYGLNLAAHLYNSSLKKHGKQEVVFTQKRKGVNGFTLDIEAAGIDKMMAEPFLVDTTLNPGWFHLGGAIAKLETGGDDAGMSKETAAAKDADRLRLTATQVIHNLADIVSKNGNMMLNVGLRADGSLPETYRRELSAIGRWLKVNGEAIYGTRPFRVFGEGPARPPKSANHFNDNEYKYSAQDIRFTTKGDLLYAICLGLPAGPTQIASLATTEKPVASVELVGSDEKLSWKKEAEGLSIQPAKTWPSEHAAVLRITFAQ
jgi:alpha-L-fucosidase